MLSIDGVKYTPIKQLDPAMGSLIDPNSLPGFLIKVLNQG